MKNMVPSHSDGSKCERTSRMLYGVCLAPPTVSHLCKSGRCQTYAFSAEHGICLPTCVSGNSSGTAGSRVFWSVLFESREAADFRNVCFVALGQGEVTDPAWPVSGGTLTHCGEAEHGNCLLPHLKLNILRTADARKMIFGSPNWKLPGHSENHGPEASGGRQV